MQLDNKNGYFCHYFSSFIIYFTDWFYFCFSCVLESQANNQTRVTYDCENQLNSTNKDFSFVAVRYPGQDNGDSVWVHCVIYTCVVGDTSSVCVDQCANCTNRRRRRDVDTLPSDNTYELIAGPYTFVEDENGKEDLPGIPVLITCYQS